MWDHVHATKTWIQSFPDQTKKDLSHDKHVYPNITLPMTKLGLHKKTNQVNMAFLKY
jgi:hypothetical protein